MNLRHVFLSADPGSGTVEVLGGSAESPVLIATAFVTGDKVACRFAASDLTVEADKLLEVLTMARSLVRGSAAAS